MSKHNKTSLRRRESTAASMAALLCCSAIGATADPQRLELTQRQTVDAYFEVNMSGKVFVAIGAKPGESPCAEFWWIKWPFGNIESLGRHCSFAIFEIPGLTNWAISTKLRAGGTQNNVKLAVSASESVARSTTFNF